MIIERFSMKLPSDKIMIFLGRMMSGAGAGLLLYSTSLNNKWAFAACSAAAMICGVFIFRKYHKSVKTD